MVGTMLGRGPLPAVVVLVDYAVIARSSMSGTRRSRRTHGGADECMWTTWIA